MVIMNKRQTQLRLISEMDRLLSYSPNASDFSINATAKYIAGEDISEWRHTRLQNITLWTISSKTIIRWYQIWKDTEMLPMDVNPKFLKENHTKWTPDADEVLREVVKLSPVSYLDEMAEKLVENTLIQFSLGSISVRLRHLGYSRQVVYEKALQQNAMERERLISTMEFLLVRVDMGIWIDESNKDRKAMRHRYGWAPKGTQAEVSNYYNQDRRYTLIAACDYIGFILEACDTVMHTVHEKQEEGTVDTERFVQYILTKFVPILGNYSRQEP